MIRPVIESTLDGQRYQCLCASLHVRLHTSTQGLIPDHDTPITYRPKHVYRHEAKACLYVGSITSLREHGDDRIVDSRFVVNRESVGVRCEDEDPWMQQNDGVATRMSNVTRANASSVRKGKSAFGWRDRCTVTV